MVWACRRGNPPGGLLLGYSTTTRGWVTPRFKKGLRAGRCRNKKPLLLRGRGGGQATSAYACPYPHSHPNPNNSHLQCPRGERKIFRALPGDSSWGGVKLLGKTGSPRPTHLIKHVGAIKGEDGDPTPYPWPPKYQPRLLDCLNQGVM